MHARDHTLKLRPNWRPAAAVAALLGALVLYVLRPLLFGAHDVIPGNDAANLYGWEIYTRAVLRAGRLPHWNPFHFAGTPHFADPQTTVLYPLALALRWLPAAPFLSWMAALHLWLAGLGAVFLARTLGLGWIAATAAGVALAIGGNAAPWLHNGHLLVIYNAAWLPWVVAFAIRSVRRGGILPHPLLPGLIVLQLLAGYLQGAIYSVAVVASYFGWAAVMRSREEGAATRMQALAQLGILGVVVLGMGAFQLFPAAQLIAQAGRTSGLPYDVAAEGGWRFADLARLFFPFRGSVAQDPFARFSDHLVYAGWILTAMVPFAIADRRRRHVVGWLVVVTAGALGLACAGSLPLYRLHYALFPGLRIPVRVLFVATMCLAVLGAIGLERFVTVVAQRQWRALAGGALAAVAAIAAAAVVTLGHNAAGIVASPGWPWPPVVGTAAIGAVALASAVGRRHVALAIAVAALVADVGVVSAHSARPVAVTPPAELHTLLGSPSDGRAISICESQVSAGDLLVDRRATVDGLAGIELRDLAAWAYLARFGDAPPDDGVFRRASNGSSMPARRDLLDQANVTTVFSCGALGGDGLVRTAAGGGLSRFENLAAWPRAVWTCGVEEMTRADAIAALRSSWYGPDRQLVPTVFINVRWVANLSAARRAEAERRYHLRDGARRDSDTWRYVMADSSTPNGAALIGDPAVADTAGLNRHTGAVVRPAPPSRSASPGGYFVTGTAPCDATARVTIVARDLTNGRTTIGVDAVRAGVLFISEAEYRERHAFLDGRRVMTMKTNLAFTGVAVPAGLHRVELRYVPEAFEYGAGTTVVTLLAWAWAVRRSGRRDQRSVPAMPETVQI